MIRLQGFGQTSSSSTVMCWSDPRKRRSVHRGGVHVLVKGPLGRKVHRDSDSFADDKIGAQKAKKEQEKKAQKELGAKTRQAELARRAERVQEATAALEDLQKVPAADRHEPGKGLEAVAKKQSKSLDSKSAMKSAGAELVKMNEVFNELEVLISAILSDIELEASSESASAQRDDTVALQRRAAQLLSSHAELEGKIEPEVLGRLKELDSSLNRARDEFRGLIQFAMSGEFGASLKDPYLQFEPLRRGRSMAGSRSTGPKLRQRQQLVSG